MTDEAFQLAISALAQGDKGALRQIYEAYVKFIYAIVYDIVKQREEAEDITSEFFIKLVRVAGGFRMGSPHRAWLAQIARNLAIDTLRKHGREVLEYPSGEDADGAANSMMESVGVDIHARSVEDSAVLSEDMRQAMATLKPKEKEVIDMKLLGQLTFKEIAEITNQPMGTVTWLYNQGITKLRRCLAAYESQ